MTFPWWCVWAAAYALKVREAAFRGWHVLDRSATLRSGDSFRIFGLGELQQILRHSNEIDIEFSSKAVHRTRRKVRGSKTTVMSQLDQANALQIAKALGDPVRFSIYRHIVAMEEVRCGDICTETTVRASTVSHHLKMLTDAGLIESRREGQGVYYSSIPSRLKAFMTYLRNLSPKERPLPVGVSPAVSGRPKQIKKSRRAVLQAMRVDLR